MVKGLFTCLFKTGFDAQKSDIHVGLTPDQGKRIRYNAIAIAAPSEWIPPRLLAILDGPAEGTIQFYEFPGAGSIGDAKRGDLMAGFTKAPFYVAAYEKRGIMKDEGHRPHVSSVYTTSCRVRLWALARFGGGDSEGHAEQESA